MVKIGLDIGHGVDTFPPDKGVMKKGKPYPEHSFNAKLGMRIKELLEANGHTVILGQQPNKKDVPLTTRTNLYNSKNVDIVVSLHANAGKSDVEGRCVFYWGTSSEGKKLAGLIRDEIRNAGYSLHGNGLHAGKIGEWTNLHITRETNMPAVLIEHGFMTNKNDFELIFGSKQDKYIEDMAQADVRGIQRYLGQDYKDVKPSAPKPSKPKPSKPSKPNTSTPKANLTVDGYWGKATTKALQRALGTVADGEIWGQYAGNQAAKAITSGVKFGKGGSPVIKALQKHVGAKQDGVLGKETVRKLQSYLGTPVDGELWKPSTVVKEMQRRLNAGTF